MGTALVIFVSFRTSAFDPDSPVYGHTFLTKSIAANGFSFNGKSVPEFTAFLTFSPNEKINFSSDAADQLVLGARSMDFLGIAFEGSGTNGSYVADEIQGGLRIDGDPNAPNAHCDDEQIVECSRRIYELTIKPTVSIGGADELRTESAIYLLDKAATLWLKPVEQKTPEDDKKALSYAAAARIQVGRGLHITQDFYAHSNWSNDLSRGTSILVALGQGAKDSSEDVSVSRVVAEPTLQTCLPNPVDRLTSDAIRGDGWLADQRPSAEAYANFAETGIRPTGWDAFLLTLDTGGLVIINKIKNNILTWNNSGGNGDLVQTGKVTSGYFDAIQHAYLGLGSANDTVGAAKCDHGFAKGGKLDYFFGISVTAKSKLAGINKDAPWAPFTKSGPSGTLGDLSHASSEHVAASYHAALATKQILQNVVDAAAKKADGDNDRRDAMVELFMGVKPTMAFVVDTTGSMQDIMDGITAQIRVLSTTVGFSSTGGGAATGSPQIDLNKKFMLTTYSESASNVASVTVHNLNGAKYVGNVEQLLARLQTLPPALGGGDCPEPTLKAVLDTARRIPRGSKIFVFSDASTKDNDTRGSDGVTRKESAEISRLVDKKKLEITFSLSGSCSPISPAYHQIAQASGGQVMLVDHTSADTAVALAGVAPGNRAFSVIHTERSTLAAGVSKGVVIPIESGASQLLISVTNDSSGIAVRSPSGGLQVLTAFLGGSVLKIANPAPGDWTVGVSGWPTTPPGAPASAYSIKAQAIGAFDLGTLEYSNKDAAGRSFHEVHMPYGNNPPATDVRVVAQLSTNAANNPSTYQWQAISEDGSLLGNLAISRKTPDQYEGTASLASISANATRPWRVRVSGTDGSGQPFARMLPTLQNATRFTANITQLPSHWVPGAEHSIKIRIDNYSGADSYSLVPSASLGSLLGVPPIANIASGDYAVQELKIKIPATTPANSAGVLQIGIKSRLADNAVVQTLNIPYTVMQDTDGDGVPDVIEKGTNGTDENFDGNGDGIPDWKQANVISMPSDQRRAYLTSSLSAGQFRLARTAPAEGLAQLKYSIDLIDFKIVGLAAGASTQMEIHLPGYMTASGYGKFGPVPGNTTAAWYDFNYDASTGVGAKIDKNVITLYLKDGAKGDDDLTANGEIVDIGGPIGVQIAGAGAASTSSTTTTTGTTSTGTSTTATGGTGGTSASGAIPFGNSSGGGGGCTLGDPRNPHPDDSLWLLLLAALGVLGVKARRDQQARHTLTSPKCY